MPALLSIGDVLTLRGVSAEGAIYPGRPLRRWRVTRLDVLEIVLQPLNDDDTIDDFADACGDYRLAVHAETPFPMN